MYDFVYKTMKILFKFERKNLLKSLSNFFHIIY